MRENEHEIEARLLGENVETVKCFDLKAISATAVYSQEHWLYIPSKEVAKNLED